MKTLIFDLDGTIINSSKEVLLCFEKAFKMANYTIDKSRLTPNIIGPPLKEIVQNIANNCTDDEIIETVIQNFRSIYDYDENDISEFFDGMYELLINESNKSKNLFLATYKPIEPTMRIVKHFKLDMFNDIYTIDKFGEHITKTQMIEHIISSNNLDKNETIMIGDALSDIVCAHNANIKAIGVLWGYGEDKTPLIKEADIVVKNAAELKQYI